MNWQEVISDVWPQVRRKHLWPELALPRVGDIDTPVAMHMHDKQITLNLATCNELAEHLPAEVVAEALLDHGVSHYTRCPWDFATHLQLYSTAKAELGRRSLAKLATDSFIDVVANTSCVKGISTPLPDIYRYLGGGILEGTLTALYTNIWGIELDGSGDPALVRRLARIPYLDRQQWMPSLRRFARLLQPIFEEEMRQSQSQPLALGRYGLDSYSVEEVLQGLQAFAQQTTSIQEFRDTVGDFTDDLASLGFGNQPRGGRGQGQRVDADILYYMQLAQAYRLPLRSLPMERSGSLEPYSHVSWEASKPVQDIDPWTSFGKLLPGLSQTWVRRDGATFGHQEGTPDCLLVLDSSGSMTNPREHLSFAVLGAGCAVEAYIRREARVAVYNFSDALADKKHILPFANDRQQIYQALCAYHGGGTSLKLRDIEILRRSTARSTPDLLLITDMQITNLEDVLSYLAGVEGRITVIHIGENSATDHFRKVTRDHPRLQVFTIQDREDIPHIVLGQVQSYFSIASPQTPKRNSLSSHTRL